MIEGDTVRHTPMRPGEIEHSVVLGNPATLAPLGWKEGDFVTLQDGLVPTIDFYRQ